MRLLFVALLAALLSSYLNAPGGVEVGVDPSVLFETKLEGFDFFRPNSRKRSGGDEERGESTNLGGDPVGEVGEVIGFEEGNTEILIALGVGL